MPDHHTVLSEILKHVPHARFKELIKSYNADGGSRRLDSKLVALLYGQLSGASGLRAIVEELESHAAALSELGCDPVKRSTLSEANRYRPAALFGDLLEAVMAQAQRGLRRHVKEPTYLIDSTSVSLSALSERWARFSAKACGAKAHIVYDPDADRPIYAAVTPARVTDLTAARAMPIKPPTSSTSATMIMAGGPTCTRRAAGSSPGSTRRSSWRASARCPPAAPSCPTAPASCPASRRRNRFQARVREVTVRIETGKVLRILSNDLDAPAQEIADLYKRRWAIELFFRWVKQTLKIRHFVGTSENAVRLQIAVALIAFVLLRLAQTTQDAIKSPLAFARLVRTNLMHRRRIDQLLPSPTHPKQPQPSGLQEAPA